MSLKPVETGNFPRHSSEGFRGCEAFPADTSSIKGPECLNPPETFTTKRLETGQDGARRQNQHGISNYWVFKIEKFKIKHFHSSAI